MPAAFTDVETVYGYLINEHANALRKGDEALREQIWSAITLFERLWPDDTQRWNDRFTDK